ncbi:unnamed protein product [Polarella glacialis]|uniref:ER membrane protein complex subunit 7 beta-sandwich domain-containing protein n=2 Tax=Polarella glacialis TaxID=89957 RepID=A0A813FS60_POLGL|nr:unnamed protein product [Polarella glacialis]
MASLLRLSLLGCALLLSPASASDSQDQSGQIRGRISIPSKFQQGLPPLGGLHEAKVILDGGLLSTLPTADGYFYFSGVSAGPHLLQVVHPRLNFDAVRLEAEDTGANGMKITAYMADPEHGRGAKLKYPLGLAPSGAFSYLEKREEFNILSVFKSPMALISLFSCGAMFLLPKLQPMIEEEKAKQQAEVEGNKGQAESLTNGKK